MNTQFQCPVCKKALELRDRTYSCDKGHQFDVAKEGYVNLLLSNQKNSKYPGDSKVMMNARRDFLNNGYYNELTTALTSIIRESGNQSPVIIDTGCGDGYYLQTIKTNLEAETDLTPVWTATDISKEAVRMAAKRDNHIECAVASSFRLPVLSESIDYMIRVFAPGEDAEIVRCLKPNGTFILVTPGPHHLFELKEAVYTTPRLHDAAIKQIDGLKLNYQESINYKLNLSEQNDILNLLTMTPYYWNGDRETKDGFDALTELQVQVEFNVSVYRKA